MRKLRLPKQIQIKSSERQRKSVRIANMRDRNKLSKEIWHLRCVSEHTKQGCPTRDRSRDDLEWECDPSIIPGAGSPAEHTGPPKMALLARSTSQSADAGFQSLEYGIFANAAFHSYVHRLLSVDPWGIDPRCLESH